MFNSFEQLLLSLGEHVVLAYVLLWLMYLFLFKRLDSYSILLSCLVVFALLMNVLTPYLYAIASSGEGAMSKAVWHLSFVSIYILAMSLTRWLHLKVKVKLSKVAVFSIYLYAIQAFVHLIRFTEKSMFSTDYTSSVYTFVIVGVNFLLVFVCVTCIIVANKDKRFTS
ncbi:hypothetical protein PCIT_a3062 [Pseudoalteromonas citrea]|uniref:Uncharacterized protein n=2 Tax=Pseudoalteromonas citrea TaxID=43655 RepID=A0AAD4AI26_9GAMM|nr:hypothetical protein [Pseudoalteromonas citrea]KAF7770103.1 hypothetical protein PCIT_a3062 [Pseudoalteromonas citrea]